jgi:hypothetical protein
MESITLTTARGLSASVCLSKYSPDSCPISRLSSELDCPIFMSRPDFHLYVVKCRHLIDRVLSEIAC